MNAAEQLALPMPACVQCETPTAPDALKHGYCRRCIGKAQAVSAWCDAHGVIGGIACASCDHDRTGRGLGPTEEEMRAVERRERMRRGWRR